MAKPDHQDSTVFSGAGFQPLAVPYEPFLKPVVWVQASLKQLKALIQEVMWAELIHGKTHQNELFHLLAFLILCLLSLLDYYLGIRFGLIVLGFTLFAQLEKRWFQEKFRYLQNHSTIELTKSNDTCCWQAQSPQGALASTEFLRTDVRQVVIACVPIHGGVFSQEIATVWRVALWLNDYRELVMDEQVEVSQAWLQARILAQALSIPVRFLDSEGADSYAMKQLAPPRSPRRQDRFIHCQRYQDQLHLYTRWTLKNSWSLLGATVDKAGFLVFVAILSSFMQTFGELVATVLGLRAGSFDINRLLTLQLDPTDWVVGAIAVAVLITEGYKISQPRHLCLSTEALQIISHRHPTRHLSRSSIESVVMLTKPTPRLAICTPTQVFVLDYFLKETDCRLLWGYLSMGLSEFEAAAPDSPSA